MRRIKTPLLFDNGTLGIDNGTGCMVLAMSTACFQVDVWR